MTVSTEDGGRLNAFAKEPRMYIDPKIEELQMQDNYETHNEKAEKLNGRISMIAVTLAMISYATTGTLAFGIW